MGWLDAEVYPDPRVESFINTNYLPVKIHIKEQPKIFERFGAQWTPPIQVLDPDGTKRHQFERFLPADDFFAQLKLGLAHSAFAWQQWKEAESRYDDIVSSLPGSDAAPEALYWLAVSRYKSSSDPVGRRRKHLRLATPTARGQRKLRSGRSNRKLSFGKRTSWRTLSSYAGIVWPGQDLLTRDGSTENYLRKPRTSHLEGEDDEHS